MGKAFTTSLVRRLRDHITEIVDGLLAPLLDLGGFDIVADLAIPLPTQVICELLGITIADRDEVRAHTVDLMGMDVPGIDAATVWFTHMAPSVRGRRRGRRPVSGGTAGRRGRRYALTTPLRALFVHNDAILPLVHWPKLETTKNLIATGARASCAPNSDGPSRRIGISDGFLASTAQSPSCSA